MGSTLSLISSLSSLLRTVCTAALRILSALNHWSFLSLSCLLCYYFCFFTTVVLIESTHASILTLLAPPLFCDKSGGGTGGHGEGQLGTPLPPPLSPSSRPVTLARFIAGEYSDVPGRSCFIRAAERIIARVLL